MRYLTPRSAAGALRRGKPIEQFLGPAFLGDRQGIRWVSIEPDREGLRFTVLYHLAEDAADSVADGAQDGAYDIYELPPLDPEAYDLWPEVGACDDPAAAMDVAERKTGAHPSFWTNHGVAADDYRDYATRARLPFPLAGKDIVALIDRVNSGEASPRVMDWMLDAVTRQTGCGHFHDLIFWPDREMTAEEIAEHVLACRPIAL